MADSPVEQQEAALQRIERLAQRRLAPLLPDMLSPSQLQEVAALQEQGTSQEELVALVVAHLPQPYDELLFATVRGVVDDILQQP